MCLDLVKQNTYFRGGTCHTLLHKSQGLSQHMEGVKRRKKKQALNKHTKKRVMIKFTFRDVCGNKLVLSLVLGCCFMGLRQRKWQWVPTFQTHVHAVWGSTWYLWTKQRAKIFCSIFPLSYLFKMFFPCPSLCVLDRIDKHPCVTK